jgi:CheY-like chemotaxis protein
MPSHRHCVLYVEDDVDTRECTEAVLRFQNCEVLAVEAAPLALEHLRDGFPCCIILLDWRLPGMSGEGFRHVQMGDDRLARIPVVVLSGDLIAIEDARRLGLRAVLRKPVDMIELIGTLDQWCESTKET